MTRVKTRILFLLLAAALLVTAFSMPVLADLEETTDELPDEEITLTEPPEEGGGVIEEEVPDGQAAFSLEDLLGGLLSAFTPEGNLTLIDDFLFRDAEGELSKQFITVQAKGGSTFYIVIDRVGEAENVYFLNLVDEADLLALMDEPEETPEREPAVCTCKDKCYAGHVDVSCPVCAVNMSECNGKEAAPEPTPVPKPSQAPEATAEPDSRQTPQGVKPALMIAVLLALAGATLFCFLKLKGKAKAKPGRRAAPDPDEEYEFEPYDPETEDDREDEGGNT